jgi:hypothetical protein
MKLSLVCTSLFLCFSFTVDIQAQQFNPAPLVSIPTHDHFFEQLRSLCGKAFQGKVTVDTPKSDGFEGKLIMHVRRCSQDEIQIPFHVGDNHSRTWIIKKTGSGLSLKHDHRHADGSFDKQTMYGGHTVDAGWAQVQSFPADQYSKELFVSVGIPQSAGNTWQMMIYPKEFSYRLIREGREFRVNFDLSKSVPLPITPWGYRD